MGGPLTGDLQNKENKQLKPYINYHHIHGTHVLEHAYWPSTNHIPTSNVVPVAAGDTINPGPVTTGIFRATVTLPCS